MRSDEPLIVAIDGPVGVGKSTVARGLARIFSVPYLETGAMYRALGVEVLAQNLDPDNREAIEELARGLDLRLELADEAGIRVMMNGRPVGAELRRPEVADITSRISAYPGVRSRMVELQRQCAERTGGVVEGRDIGSRVFPNTRYKFFLDADVHERARRRHEELLLSGHHELTLEQVVSDIQQRDDRDSKRADSPLRSDESYIPVETTRRSVDEVIEYIAAAVRRLAAEPA